MTSTDLIPTLDVEIANISLAIFWKSLDELDIYTNNQVKTVNGTHAEIIAGILKSHNISVEVME